MKQLRYHSCFIDMIINQRHACKNLGDTFFPPTFVKKKKTNLRNILNFQEPQQNRRLKSKYTGKYQGNGAMQEELEKPDSF